MRKGCSNINHSRKLNTKYTLQDLEIFFLANGVNGTYRTYVSLLTSAIRDVPHEVSKHPNMLTILSIETRPVRNGA